MPYSSPSKLQISLRRRLYCLYCCELFVASRETVVYMRWHCCVVALQVQTQSLWVCLRATITYWSVWLRRGSLGYSPRNRWSTSWKFSLDAAEKISKLLTQLVSLSALAAAVVNWYSLVHRICCGSCNSIQLVLVSDSFGCDYWTKHCVWSLLQLVAQVFELRTEGTGESSMQVSAISISLVVISLQLRS